jgi:hypothetical protein
VDELLARFPEVPRDLRDEPILPEYVKAFGPLLRMAQKPSPCVGSSGDAQHVFYTPLVNDLAIHAIGLATRDRTLVRLQATLAQYRQQPPTFACTLVPRRAPGAPSRLRLKVRARALRPVNCRLYPDGGARPRSLSLCGSRRCFLMSCFPFALR